MIDNQDRCELVNVLFLLVPAHLGSPRQNPESLKMVVVVVNVVTDSHMNSYKRYYCSGLPKSQNG